MIISEAVRKKDKVLYLFVGGAAAAHNGFATKGNGRVARTALLLIIHV